MTRRSEARGDAEGAVRDTVDADLPPQVHALLIGVVIHRRIVIGGKKRIRAAAGDLQRDW